MLGKQISQLKWLSLGFLMAGIALVQLPSSSATISTVGNPVVGFSAVISACFMSGFAGVYFEKVHHLERDTSFMSQDIVRMRKHLKGDD